MDLQEYFQSYSGYFWEWENEIQSEVSVYESVTIPNGMTIGYEAYIMEVLEYLAIESIPPFGSLLLSLIATNSNANATLIRVFKEEATPFKDNISIIEMLAESRKFLDKLAALPQNYKQGNKRKQLLQTIFSGCHNRLSPEKAKAILDEYKQNRHHLLRAGNKLNFSFANFQKDFRTLALLNKKFENTDAILLALGGLPELPEITEEIAEEPAVTGTPDFIEQLMQEPRTFPVGSLVKRVWSGLNIPLHHFASGRQPLGGISDLTNKGDFDKLLISEFANDDDVFMLRLANNEALYIEREVPPENDKFLRLILVDVSLKNWGTPKILGYASALAVATHPKTNIECRVFAVADNYKEVLYSTVDDVINGLDILSGKLDASVGFSAFLESEMVTGNPEIFIISAASGLKMPAVQKVLNDHQEKIKYIIEPDFEGNLNFYKIQNRARKLIQHINLPLEELWKNMPQVTAKSGRTKLPKNRELPFYPLFYPLRASVLQTFMLGGYIYLLSSNRGLYKTYIKENSINHYANQRYKGCELLLEDLSVKSGGIHILDIVDNDYILVSYYKKERLVSYHNLSTSEYSKIPFAGTGSNYKIFNKTNNSTGLNIYYLFDSLSDEYFIIQFTNDSLTLTTVSSNIHVATEYNIETDLLLGYKDRPGSNILKNYLPVCIDKSGKLHFNKHELNAYINNRDEQYSSFRMVANRNFIPAITADYNNNRNTDKFTFPDGSEVIKDKRGMITLVSSHHSIPDIYIPANVDHDLGMATLTEFAGNTYFYKDKDNDPLTKISVKAFNDKYLQPFIQNILHHGA